MGCFSCSIPKFEEEEPLIVDVNEILSDKAWNNFKYSFGYFGRKFMKRKDFTIEVPDNYFLFEQIHQSLTNPARGLRTSSGKGIESASTPKGLLEGKVPTHRASNPETVSVDTVFSNDTAQKQTYQFKFSKTRTTSIEVTYQKGFTVGGKASFSIGLPKVMSDGSLGLEAEMQFQVTKSEGQKFEETMNMETTNDISVGPRTNYVANVQLEERSVQANFQVRTRMSMPQGRAPIFIRRKSDNVVVYVYKVTNLKDIFIGEVCSAEKVFEDDQPVQDKIDFVVEGVIKGSLACDHRINLSSDETDEEKQLAKMKGLTCEDD